MSVERTDDRIVMTLDAGGTNLVFGAISQNRYVTAPITLPSNANDLDRCLASMVEGFEMVKSQLARPPVAISFAFPGPADYPNGVIGGYLPNFPSFRQGVALGPFLAKRFGIPVYINNDGDLFALGEALAGRLPEINARLAAMGSKKRFRNMIGYTFGTGFGVGIVSGGKLHEGDNSCVETFCLKNGLYPGLIAEATVSAGGVCRGYARLVGAKGEGLSTKDIYDIADGQKAGDMNAAREAFRLFGVAAGDAIATAATLIDGIVVLGGGVARGSKYFMPALLGEMRGKIKNYNGEELDRLQMGVYDLDDDAGFERFARGGLRRIKIYGSDECADYDPEKRIGVTVSSLGTSLAISIGAAAYALDRLKG